ncbi:MAG: hypothetical protein KDB36_11755 [Acidimicrobiales bacterium]|nr:hypothetical protein [Acidimicrobiales bacterium]
MGGRRGARGARRRWRSAGSALVLVVAIGALGACGEAADGPAATTADAGNGSIDVDREAAWQIVARGDGPIEGVELANPQVLALGGDDLVIAGGPGPVLLSGDGAWGASSPPPVDAVLDVSAVGPVWTGTEVIEVLRERPGPDAPIVGDGVAAGAQVAVAYDPATDEWRRLPEPAAHEIEGMVWAGDEVLAWGCGHRAVALDPAGTSWRTVSEAPVPAPLAATSEEAMWTGDALVVVTSGWSGVLDAGAAAWRDLPRPPHECGAVRWTGAEVLCLDLDHGGLARLDLAADAWTTAAAPPAAEGRSSPAVVWSGDRLVVLGGRQFDYTPSSAPPRPVTTGLVWDAAADAWSQAPDLPDGVDAVIGAGAHGDAVLVAGVDPSSGDLVTAAWQPAGSG